MRLVKLNCKKQNIERYNRLKCVEMKLLFLVYCLTRFCEFTVFLFSLVLSWAGLSLLQASTAPAPTPGMMMNNGCRDNSHNDIQKLQQQLQDIKEQVKYIIYYFAISFFYCSYKHCG